MSGQFDDFDLDVRFHAEPSVQSILSRAAPTSPAVCEVIVPTVLGCEHPPVKTAEIACEIHIQPTVLLHTCEQTCANTCQNTCDPKVCGVTNPAVCDTNTCNLGCETNTCPDATCGCNTNETCDHL